MNNFKSAVFGAGFLILASAAPASAHHSYAAFDSTKTLQIVGTVVTWEWTNPHAHMQLAALNDKGAPQTFDMEMSSPNILRSGGWTRDSIKPGDKITVQYHPRRDGSPGGTPVTVITADGHVLGKAINGPGGAERQ